jgi:hypothetical protein
VRRLDLAKETGVRRVAWNLRGEAPAAQVGRGGGRSAAPQTEADQDDQPVFTGRGGAPQGSLVAVGRYRATLGRLVGDIVHPSASPSSRFSCRGSDDDLT